MRLSSWFYSASATRTPRTQWLGFSPKSLACLLFAKSQKPTTKGQQGYGRKRTGERPDVPVELLAQGVLGEIPAAVFCQGGGMDLGVRRQVLPDGGFGFRLAIAKEQVSCQRELARRRFLIPVQ